MPKKAEIPSIVFVFLVGIIVFGIVLLLGGKIISSFFGTQDSLDEADFKQQLQSDILALKGDSGSIRTKTYMLSRDINTICFANVNNKGELPDLFVKEYPLAADSVDAGKNLILIGKEVKTLKIEQVDSDGKTFCVSLVDGMLNLGLQGNGDSVGLFTEQDSTYEIGPKGSNDETTIHDNAFSSTLTLKPKTKINNATKNTEITYKKKLKQEVPPANLVSDPVQIYPDNATLSQPAELTIVYNNEEVTDPNVLEIVHLEGEQWEHINGEQTVNEEEHTITANVSELGTYAVVELSDGVGQIDLEEDSNNQENENNAGANPCTMNGEGEYPSGSTWTFYDVNESHGQGECTLHGRPRTCMNGDWSGSDSYHFYSCKDPKPINAFILGDSSLLQGGLGKPYSDTFHGAGGGTPPYAYQIIAGSLPPGVSLTGTTPSPFYAMKIEGTPAAPGFYPLKIKATDSNGAGAVGSFWLQVPTAWISAGPRGRPSGVVGLPYASSDYFGVNSNCKVLSGNIPVGLTLDEGCNLIGIPSASGTTTFRVGSETDFGTKSEKTYSIYIAPAGSKAISPSTLSHATIGFEYRDSAGALLQTYLQPIPSAPGSSFELVSGSLPPGMTLEQTGSIHGIPTTPGTYSFQVKMDNEVTQQYSLTVSQPITISPSSLPTMKAGEPIGGGSFSCSGTKACSYSFIAGNMPSWFNFFPADGSFYALAPVTGTYTFTMQAIDDNGVLGRKEYTLVVQ